jgi:hypothetical protein
MLRVSFLFGEICRKDDDLEIVYLKDDTSKQTFTFGEICTLVLPIAPSPSFTGPVDVAHGEFDRIFAQGNASHPTDHAALVQSVLFRNVGKESQRYLVPGTGHAINLHFSAYHQVQVFVKNNGF